LGGEIMINASIISKQDTHSGIYAIVNLKNNKFYIGSTKNLYKRTKYEHKRLLDINKHPNVYLQRAYNKDSKYFIYLSIEKVNIDRLLEREQFWIDDLNACVDGYNLSPTASSTTGFKMPREAIQLGVKKRQRAVAQFSKEGILINKWESIKIAQDSLEIKGNHIVNCCKKKVKSCHGFVWMYLEDYEKEDFNFDSFTFTEEKPKRTFKSRKVSQYDLKGNLIKTWTSGKDAAKELSLDYKGISGNASGGRKTYAKFIWKYEED
jgi:group I intron endonuclease